MACKTVERGLILAGQVHATAVAALTDGAVWQGRAHGAIQIVVLVLRHGGGVGSSARSRRGDDAPARIEGPIGRHFFAREADRSGTDDSTITVEQLLAASAKAVGSASLLDGHGEAGVNVPGGGLQLGVRLGRKRVHGGASRIHRQRAATEAVIAVLDAHAIGVDQSLHLSEIRREGDLRLVPFRVHDQHREKLGVVVEYFGDSIELARGTPRDRVDIPVVVMTI
jgi:hypothetical protein